jgi:hypothetical protein
MAAYSLPAATLGTNGDTLVIKAYFDQTSPNDVKSEVKLTIGPSTIASDVPIDFGLQSMIDITVTRESATEVYITWKQTNNDEASYKIASGIQFQSAKVTVSDLDNNANSIAWTGKTDGTNTLTQTFFSAIAHLI